VTRAPHIGDRFRRWVRLACVVAVGAFLAAPMMLGPALAPLARAIAGEPAHRCACGMIQGTCGCPECELAVGAMHADDDDSPRPVLKSSCDDGAPMLPSFATIPPATLPVSATIPPLASAPAEPLAIASLVARDRTPPPTPPPRNARV